MKNLSRILFAILLMWGLFSPHGFSQDQQTNHPVVYKIIKQNGAAFVGTIISQDAREILIQTEDVGLVYIPKHEVDEIILMEEKSQEISGGLFSTRYFLTTNGFNIKKGENYVQWNLFGPDFQFGVRDNFTMGIMTSWVGMPIVLTTKYSIQMNDKLFGGVGFLGGTGSWAFPRYGLVLPYAFVTAGDRINNINFSFGYGGLFFEDERYVLINQATEYSTNTYNSESYSRFEGRPLFSLAGMFRINDKFSFVFDSFFMTAGKSREVEYIDQNYDPVTNREIFFLRTRTEETTPLIVLAPGLRFQANEKSSFQFGFTGIHTDGEFIPVPIPMVQWFRRI